MCLLKIVPLTICLTIESLNKGHNSYYPIDAFKSETSNPPSPPISSPSFKDVVIIMYVINRALFVCMC